MNAAMCNRHVLGHAGSRPSVLLPLGLAIFFLTTKWALLAGIFMLVALVRGVRLVTHPELRTRLRLKRELRRRGITRPLGRAEAEAVLAFERYGRELVAAGGSSELAREVVDRAWAIIAASGPASAEAALRTLWQSLPRVGAAAETDDAWLQRLRREVTSIDRAQRELDRLGL
jgi:hypothetical protein